MAGSSDGLAAGKMQLDNHPFGSSYVACVARPVASILGRVISVHMLCLDVCLSQPPKLTEITQFISGQTERRLFVTSQKIVVFDVYTHPKIQLESCYEINSLTSQYKYDKFSILWEIGDRAICGME